MNDIVLEFIKNFNLPRDGFSEPIPFIDSFGFSTLKNSKKETNYSSLYKFYIDNKSIENSEKLKPIIISVSYGEKNENGGITISSTAKKLKKTINSPVDLVSNDEYYYNFGSNKLFFKGKEISGVELLKKIENLHTKPTLIITGLSLRLKLFFFRSFVPAMIYYFYTFFVQTLHIISGTITNKNLYSVIVPTNSFNDMSPAYRKESFANEKIDIFGYKASAWSVVVYAIIHFFLYTVWYFCYRNGNLDFFKILFQSTFFTLTYVIPTLVLFERIIPEWLQLLIVYTGRLYNKSSIRRVTI